MKERKWNGEVHFMEDEYPIGKSEPAKHVIENASHKFTWELLLV